MENSSGLVYTLLTVIGALGGGAFTFLLRDRERLLAENADLRLEGMAALQSSAKLAEQVPDLTNKNLQAVLEIQRLNQRIADLEK